MKAKNFDRRFDAGKSVMRYLDMKSVRRPGQEPRRLSVTVPSWMVESLDREAKRLGVSRQAVIRKWFTERLKRRAS